MIGRLLIIKMSILPKLICRFNVIPTKIPVRVLVDIYKIIVKFIWKGKDAVLTITILTKKNTMGGVILAYLKLVI